MAESTVEQLPSKIRDTRSTTTASKDLYDIFYGDKLYTFNMNMNEKRIGMMTVGQRHIFFHASILPKNMADLTTHSCIHLYDISSFNVNDTKSVLYLDSYYDVDPRVKRLCKEHHLLFGDTRNATLFKIFDVIADAISYDTIELIDGSRTTLPDGREWNLRVLNTMLGKSQTFYEKFGFTAIYKVPDFKDLRIPLDGPTKEYVRKHMEIPVDRVTLPDLVKHLYHTKGMGESGAQWDPEDAAVIKFIIGAVDGYIKKIYKNDNIYPNAYTKTIDPSFDYVIEGNTITFNTKGGKTKRKRKRRKTYKK
jgi:hypothetical protein